jgi:hypothetical protein
MTMPEHGTRARYRRGCKCERCRGANASYARGRRKRLAHGRAESERLDRLKVIETHAPQHATWVPGGCVEKMAKLVEQYCSDGRIDPRDPVTDLRLAELMTAATIMDAPKRSNLFKDEVKVVADLLHELGVVEAADAGSNEAAALVAAIRGTG